MVLKGPNFGPRDDLNVLRALHLKERIDIPCHIQGPIERLIKNGYLVNNTLTSKASELLDSSPAKTEEIFVKYKYDLRFDAPDLVEGGKSRPFCLELMDLNKLYSREDIEQMSSEEDRNVWEVRGGWYTNPNTNVPRPSCRHIWKQIIVTKNG